MRTIRVRLTLKEGMLGTSPMNEEIYRDFIGSKAPDASTVDDEVEALGVDAVVEKGMTVFPRDEEGRPFLYDYQIKGFFKDSCQMLARLTKKDEVLGKKMKAVNESSKIKAYKKVIDGMIFPIPRRIIINLPEGGEVTLCQRPLRAMTAQGERVALACSEEVPAGSWMEFDIFCMDDEHIKAVKEWLIYGGLRGLGQWRNSGKGRFRFEILEEREGV